jgi:hypothetical protein
MDNEVTKQCGDLDFISWERRRQKRESIQVQPETHELEQVGEVREVQDKPVIRRRASYVTV